MITILTTLIICLALCELEITIIHDDKSETKIW